MSISLEAPVTTTKSERHSSLSPAQIMEVARAREASLSRLLMVYISSGLVFMLLPGTFLGVWNILQISGRESAGSISPAWIQAHGHAQVFGWIGSFILGIGFYSIPKLRGATKPGFGAAWACWAMWTIGVAVRWAANVYAWQWRLLLPLSGVLELAAFLIFFRAVSQHRPEDSGKSRLEPWIWVVISASTGLMLTLIANLAACFYLAVRSASPALVTHSRPTLSSVSRMGIPGAVRLGIQYQMDDSVPWSQACSSQAALGRAGGELCWRCFDALGMGR